MQFGVFRQFEDAVRERLNLDLFAIRTSVIQNVLLSAITPADETQPTVSPSLGSYAACRLATAVLSLGPSTGWM